MPKINVYLPSWLADAVKESAVPVSSICQQALTEAVRAAGAEPAERGSRTEDLRGLLTNRAREVLRTARGNSRQPSLALLAALDAEGANLALVVLDSLGVSREALRSQLPTPEAGGENLDWFLDRAATEAADLGDQYIGCEHLLLAVIADPAADRFLTALGADPVAVRQAARTASAAATYARNRTVFAGALDELRGRLNRLEQR
jgi:hypothetical protein